jgi:hypothetical protein
MFAKYLGEKTFDLFQRTGLPQEIQLEYIASDKERIRSVLKDYYSQAGDKGKAHRAVNNLTKGQIETVKVFLTRLANKSL